MVILVKTINKSIVLVFSFALRYFDGYCNMSDFYKQEIDTFKTSITFKRSARKI